MFTSVLILSIAQLTLSSKLWCGVPFPVANSISDGDMDRDNQGECSKICNGGFSLSNSTKTSLNSTISICSIKSSASGAACNPSCKLFCKGVGSSPYLHCSQCITDKDCGSKKICNINNRCVPKQSDSGRSCSKNSDCKSNTCSRGKCSSQCISPGYQCHSKANNYGCCGGASCKNVTSTYSVCKLPSTKLTCVPIFGQCGGDHGFTGRTNCCQGKCVKLNQHHSQCQ